MNLTMAVSKTLLLGTLGRDLAAKLLKDKGRELAIALREALPESYSFLVVLGDGEARAFFSDSERADVIKSLRSVLAELEAAA